MSGRLAGKVALLTGAASGIGRATALRFAREGARVFITGLEADALARLAAEVEASGGEAEWRVGDVRLADDVAGAMTAVAKRFGGLDIVFNNAGIEWVASLQDTAEEDWDRVVDTNLKGVYLVTRQAVPLMRGRSGAAVVNNASQLGFAAIANYAAYCASKGGVVNLTRAMALDLAPEQIRVNAVCPGAVLTPLLERQCARPGGPTLQAIAQQNALRRIASPDEIASAALFLASDEASFVTGTSLVVDGGYLAT